jgi:hypothetical protein
MQEEGVLDSMVRWYQERHILLHGIDAPNGWGIDEDVSYRIKVS